MFLFLRNQGIFSSIVMQNFWSTKGSFQFPNYLCNMLVFCLGGYYYYILQSVLNMIDKKSKYALYLFFWLCRAITLGIFQFRSASSD